METATGLTILGTALGSAKVVEKPLGPTADYLGDGLRAWTEKRVGNVTRILAHAADLLGDELDAPGIVPPKVLKSVLNDGSFCDDALSAEYFGGVLASSRTEIGRDDRGAAIMALLSRMTSYQIRTHYVFFRIIRELFTGSGLVVNKPEERTALMAFVPFDVYVAAMDFSDDEQKQGDAIPAHVMFGLAKEGLIESNFRFGPTDYMKRHYSPVSRPGILFAPGAAGAELMLWAMGLGAVTIGRFLSPDIRFPEAGFPIPAGAERVDRRFLTL